MEISESLQNNHLVIAPSGRLDSVNAPILDKKLSSVIERGDIRLVIDLTTLEYISSIGLSTLLSAAKKIKRMDGRIVLAGMNDRVRMIMEISGFNRLFVIFPNVEAAVVG